MIRKLLVYTFVRAFSSLIYHMPKILAKSIDMSQSTVHFIVLATCSYTIL